MCDTIREVGRTNTFPNLHLLELPVYDGPCYFPPNNRLLNFLSNNFGLAMILPPPFSRPCSLEEQYFKCGIFWDYDTAQRHASNSEAPVLAGGVSVFLRGTQFSGASELKEGLVSK